MKAIISHDVDHLTAWEHCRDLALPKFLIRSTFQLTLGSISAQEWRFRISSVFKNQWNNLEDIMAFDQRQGIPATFFVGVSKGKGLSYSVANARTWIIHLLHNGFDVGVHGIAYDNFELMQREYRTFKAISGLDMFGIRMHYLRKNADTLQILEKIGYLFDSSVYEITGPKTIGQTWEFPLHIMDTRILYQGMTQPVSFAEARRRTTGIIQQVMALNLPYLTVLFHDHYYCDSYPLWQDWYEWLIKYLKDLGVSFCDYREAMREIR